MMVAMEATSLRFAAAARVLGQTARRRGLDVPSFRSPPRLQGADRSLRRHASGSTTVSVRLKGRPWSAVVADMIDGVVAANQLTGNGADRARTALWAAVESDAMRAQAVANATRRRTDDPANGSARGTRSPRSTGRFPARLPGAAAAPAGARTDRPSGPAGRPPLRAVPTRDVA
jgi:hypothetical protein